MALSTEQLLSDALLKAIQFHGSYAILNLYKKNLINPKEVASLMQSSKKLEDDWLSEESKQFLASFIVDNRDILFDIPSSQRTELSEQEIEKLFGAVPHLSLFLTPNIADRRSLFFRQTSKYDVLVCQVTHILQDAIILRLLCCESNPDLKVDDLKFCCFLQESLSVAVNAYVRAVLVKYDPHKQALQVSCKKECLSEKQSGLKLGKISENELPEVFRFFLNLSEGDQNLFSYLRIANETDLLEKQMEHLGIDPKGLESFQPPLKNIELHEILQSKVEKKQAEANAERKKKIEQCANEGRNEEALELLQSCAEHNDLDIKMIYLRGVVNSNLKKYTEATKDFEIAIEYGGKSKFVEHAKILLRKLYQDWAKIQKINKKHDESFTSLIRAQELKSTVNGLNEVLHNIMFQSRNIVYPGYYEDEEELELEIEQIPELEIKQSHDAPLLEEIESPEQPEEQTPESEPVSEVVPGNEVEKQETLNVGSLDYKDRHRPRKRSLSQRSYESHHSSSSHRRHHKSKPHRHSSRHISRRYRRYSRSRSTSSSSRDSFDTKKTSSSSSSVYTQIPPARPPPSLPQAGKKNAVSIIQNLLLDSKNQ